MTKKLREYAGDDLDEAIKRMASLADVLKEVDQKLREREETGNDEQKQDAKFCRFFHDFNLHTNTTILNANPRQLDLELLKKVSKRDSSADAINDILKAISDTIPELRRRIMKRVDENPGVPAFPKLTPDDGDLPEWVSLLCRLQRKLSSKKRSGLRKRDFPVAFERFSSGELSFQLDSLVVACQPSSGYYFYFGEYALLALDNSCAPKHWTKSAPFLLYTQRVFAERYNPGPPVADRTVASYSPDTFVQSDVTIEEHKKWERWREEYENAPLNDLDNKEGLTTKAGKNAYDFLRGEGGP